MPLREVVDNAVSVAPKQTGAIELNDGVTFGFTVMVNVVGIAH